MWKTGVYALGRAGDFGAGWRFDLLDVNLHTTASKRSDSEYCSGSTPSFHAGDLVYLTIAGQEHAFYFDPDPQMGSTGVNPFSQVWYPHFKPVNGETGQLTLGTGSDGLVSKMALSRTQTGEFYYVGGSTIMSGFNPASSDFGGVYIYQTADGTKYTIDASTGKLQMIQSKQGATATLANSVITGPSNQTIVITRNGNSLITQIDVKTAGGTTVNTVKYANDSKGRLLEVTYADDSTAGYLYGNSAFPNHITGLTKGTTADTHSLRTLTVKYDAQGRMQTLLDMYDKPTTIGGGTMSGNTSQSVTDSTGTSAEVIQDDHGNPIRTITQVRDDQGKLTGYQVNVAQYEYSYTGLVMSARQSRTFIVAGADGVGLRYSIGPASASDWQSVTSYDLINPNTYEQLLFPGKVLSQTDASGRMTTYTYSYPLAQDGSQLDSVLASVTDPYGNVTAYHYYGENSQAPCDATKGELRDSLWYTENPLGDKTYYSYTADDTYTYPYLNVDGTYRYEYVDYSGLPKGLVLDTWRLVGNTKVYQSRNYYYTSGDHKGELWKTVDTAGVTTEYVYSFSDGGTADDLSDDRQIAEVRRWTNANGTQYVRESYTASDLLGRVRLTRDANGKETKTEYDAFGRVFKTTDQCNNDTFYDYNAAGQLVCTRYADGTQTCTVYDKQGRVEWTTDRYLPGGALHNGTHSFYDSLGRAYRTDRVKNLSVIIEFDADIYNANGVKVLWSRPGTSTPTTLSSSQSFYNDQGEVVKQTGADGQSTSTTTDTGPENATIGTTGYASRQTTTDALGNTTTSATDVYNTSTKTWTHGSVTVDALGHATTADYDALGRAVKVTYADRSFAETLYSLGTEAISRTGLTAPTAAEGWPGIPAGGSEVVKIEQRKSGGALVGTYYLYDKAGNLSDLWLPAVVDGDPNSATYNQPVRPHWHYTYDANGNQLSQVDPEGHTTSFTYDEFGQRLSRTLPAVSSTTVTETWTYDGFGRMRTHTDFDGQVTMYVYDNDTGLADAPTCKGADLPDAPDTAGYSSRLSGDSKRWA